MAKKENPLVISFNKPIKFEEKEIKQIDLSGLEKLRTPDLIEAEKQFLQEGNFSGQPETTFAYAKIIAEKVTDLPLEFYDKLNAKQMTRIRNVVGLFFLDED